MPSSDSSPRKTTFEASVAICSEASSTPIAIGRSYDGPDLRISAGARFTVMRRGGKMNPLFLTAARTRSRASCTAASGKPDDVELHQALASDVDFDLDKLAFQADDGAGPDLRQHRTLLCLSGCSADRGTGGGVSLRSSRHQAPFR